VSPGCEDVAVEAPDTRKLWNANARAWTELSRAGFDVYRDLVNTPAFFAMLPAVSGLVGLDLGCGEGHNTRLLAARGADVVALDLSEYFIESAAAENQRGIRFVLGDGAHLPFRSSTFDFATAFMSLMDVGKPERALQEVSRVLKPEASSSSRWLIRRRPRPSDTGWTTRPAIGTRSQSVTTSTRVR
jgi:SAM-dependent methyltransferase